MKSVTIIGTGLMGCSIGKALKKKGYVVTGYDKSLDNLYHAKRIKAVDYISDEINEAISVSDIIMLTVPVDSIISFLNKILDVISESQIVIDAGSSKGDICKAVRNHPKRHLFVASHPMAGSECSGPSKSQPDLFWNKKVVICEEELSSKETLKIASKVFYDLGMEETFLSPEDHDIAVALVSHLPQVISYVYAGMEEFFNDEDNSWQELAAGGFNSMTRLAVSSPEIWMPILKQNKKNVVKSLRSFMKTMEEFTNNLENDNSDFIISKMRKATDIKLKHNRNKILQKN